MTRARLHSLRTWLWSLAAALALAPPATAAGVARLELRG